MPSLGEDWPRHLGDLILLEMSNRSWSLAMVGDHLGIDSGHVRKWISGEKRPPSKHLTGIARFVGIDMATAFTLNGMSRRVRHFSHGCLPLSRITGA